MSSVIQRLEGLGLIKPPTFLSSNTMYEVITGSVSYGVSNDTSDMDVVGFAIPPKDYLFPHLRGEVAGFSTPGPKFEEYQQHHVKDTNAAKQYDLKIYNIVRFFRLAMEGNPNMVDCLFVPRRCILHSTQIAELVRENRHKFLHKGAWPKFKGYAYGQMSKVKDKNVRLFVEICQRNRLKTVVDLDTIESEIENRSTSGGTDAFRHIPDEDLRELARLLRVAKQEQGWTKRIGSVEKYGFDVKFAYHVVRLMNEIEQILVDHDLDLEKNREQLKSIRKGEWTLEQLEQHFADKEKALEQVYLDSTLPARPDEEAIRQLLIDCLEIHYGSLSAVVPKSVTVDSLLSEMQGVLDKYRN